MAFGRDTTARPRGGSPENPRAPFRHRRRRAFALGALLLLDLAAVGWLLVARGDLASVRLFGVGLGWWAVLVSYAVAALTAAEGLRSRGGQPRR